MNTCLNKENKSNSLIVQFLSQYNQPDLLALLTDWRTKSLKNENNIIIIINKKIFTLEKYFKQNFISLNNDFNVRYTHTMQKLILPAGHFV